MDLKTNETRIHDTVLYAVASQIGTSEFFNWQHPAYQGYVLNMDHCKPGGDICIYQLQQRSKQNEYHKVNVYFKDRAKRPHYICPIEIKTTQGSIDTAALLGLDEACKVKGYDGHDWAYRISIACHFESFEDFGSFTTALCLMQRSDQDKPDEMWRVDSFADFLHLCSILNKSIHDGYYGRPYSNQQTYVEYDPEYAPHPTWKDYAIKQLLNLVVHEKIKTKQARFIQVLIDEDLINHEMFSPYKKTNDWLQYAGIAQSTFKSYTYELQSEHVIEMQKIKQGNTDLYAFRLGRALVI